MGLFSFLSDAAPPSYPIKSKNLIDTIKFAMKHRKMNEDDAPKYFNIFCRRIQAELEANLGEEGFLKEYKIRRQINPEGDHYEWLEIMLYSQSGSIGKTDKTLKLIWKYFIKDDLK